MNIWSIYSRVYDNLNRLKPYSQMLQDVYSELKAKPGDNILDAGCGTGNMISLLLSNSELNIVGIDSCKEMIDKAEGKIQLKSTCRLIVNNLNDKLSFNDDYFDSIIMVNVLYALDNPESVLKELYRVLKLNGVLVLVNPLHKKTNLDAFYEHCKTSQKRPINNIVLFFSLLTIGLINLFLTKDKKRNFQVFSEQEFSDLLIKCGFTLEKAKNTYSSQALLLVLTK